MSRRSRRPSSTTRRKPALLLLPLSRSRLRSLRKESEEEFEETVARFKKVSDEFERRDHGDHQAQRRGCDGLISISSSETESSSGVRLSAVRAPSPPSSALWSRYAYDAEYSPQAMFSPR